MRQDRSSGRTGRLGEEREELRAAARTHSRASDLRPAHAVWHRRECLERCCRGTAPLGQILRGLVIDLSALIRRHVRPYVLRVTPSMLVPSFLPSLSPSRAKQTLPLSSTTALRHSLALSCRPLYSTEPHGTDLLCRDIKPGFCRPRVRNASAHSRPCAKSRRRCGPSPGADVREVPAQMWTKSPRRCAPSPAAVAILGPCR
jgi:hypothetical protein